MLLREKMRAQNIERHHDRISRVKIQVLLWNSLKNWSMLSLLRDVSCIAFLKIILLEFIGAQDANRMLSVNKFR